MEATQRKEERFGDKRELGIAGMSLLLLSMCTTGPTLFDVRTELVRGIHQARLFEKVNAVRHHRVRSVYRSHLTNVSVLCAQSAHLLLVV